MKKLICEMCGSADLMEKNGLFVCQYCGAKYSPEEAKRIVIDGPVDVTGSTVKVDTSDELANLYQLARRAKSNNNSEAAAQYYNMILIKNPTSWEAAFYVVYFKAMMCKIAQISSAALSVENCIATTLGLIKDFVEKKEETISAVQEVTSHCVYISDLLFNAAEKHYLEIDLSIKNKYMQEMLDNCGNATDILYTLGDGIDILFSEWPELNACSVIAWKNAIQKHNRLVKQLSDGEKQKDRILKYASKIQKYDKTYQPPEINTSSGCFIATAVYGSYDCPQVWTLRRFRDDILAETWYGRSFIRSYYAISPTLVKLFGHTEWFKRLWKRRLDCMISSLNSQGIKDTPYMDKKW